tara:strand:- start:965 stop:1369 length:405 start_codon:yes stop_codon:yes gene_type:complete
MANNNKRNQNVTSILIFVAIIAGIIIFIMNSSDSNTVTSGIKTNIENSLKSTSTTSTTSTTRNSNIETNYGMYDSYYVSGTTANDIDDCKTDPMYDIGCMDLFDQVEGCDGETYTNSCKARVAGILKDSEGQYW